MIRLLPLYLVYLTVFGIEAYAKFSSSKVPAWFLSQFGGTVLDLFSGALAIQFYAIGVAELSVCGLLVLSLWRREFQPHARRRYLGYALFAAQLIFVGLGFGMRLTRQFDQSFQLFVYFGLTFALSRMALDYSKE